MESGKRGCKGGMHPMYLLSSGTACTNECQKKPFSPPSHISLVSPISFFFYEKGTRIEWNSVFGFAPTDAVNLHRNHPKLALCSGSLASLNLSIHVCRNWFLFIFCSSRVYISSLTNMMPCCWWIHKHPFPTLTVSDWETTSPLQPQDQVVCFTLFPDLWDFIWLFIYFGMRLW